MRRMTPARITGNFKWQHRQKREQFVCLKTRVVCFLKNVEVPNRKIVDEIKQRMQEIIDLFYRKTLLEIRNQIFIEFSRDFVNYPYLII